MRRLHFVIILLFGTLFSSCNYSPTSIIVISDSTDSKPSVTIPIKEVDGGFNDFIEKFSTDSAFQFSRIKLPLKVQCYDIVNDKDSITFKEKSRLEMIDLRKQTSDGKFEQEVILDNNSACATVTVSGIDNGVMVSYLFKKINGIWMLMEINDGST